ncbi:MAG: serine/threonine protein kinase [Clostridium sp.]|nr:serine/threonine protein kinase [Clostridium sp.]
MNNFSEKDLTEGFRILRLIQEDSECNIELAERISDGEKMIKRTYYEDKREVFGVLSRRQLPHVAQVKAVIFHTDTIILEEYIEGETLGKYLLHETINEREAIRMMKELLYAVSGIHKLGIIHRDIKPDNIMVDKNGRIYLIDFGIARIYRPGGEKDTRLLGTVGYAAPEQFGYAQSDFRTDIFSIGITCRDIHQVCQRTGACRKSRILQKIERKCTRLDPAERYPDVAAILVEFKRKRLRIAGGLSALLVAALLMLVLCLNRFFAVKNGKTSDSEKDFSFAGQKEKEIASVLEGGHRIFSGQESAPCLLLAEGTRQETEIDITGQSEAIQIEAALDEEKLSVSIVDASQNRYDFALANQYDIVEDYAGTSLYAELLFYDTDSDGIKEIWAAVSDRAYTTLKNGVETIRQNYIAGWCIYRDENNDFQLAEGQLIDYEGIEIDGTISGGVWLKDAFMGYVLQDGVLEVCLW